jgi:hypothetical protein
LIEELMYQWGGREREEREGEFEVEAGMGF